MCEVSKQMVICADTLRGSIGKHVFTSTQDVRLAQTALDLEILARNHSNVCRECAEAMDREFEEVSN